MGGQVSTSSSFSNLRCRNANEDWMSTLSPRLWDVPLHHLSIPGSHDTMTYCLNKKSPISHEESRLLQLLNKAFPCITRPMVLKWSVTQALDVTEQLDAGVRYLDLRIAHMLEGSEKNLHFVHMVYTTALVEVRPGGLFVAGTNLTENLQYVLAHPSESLEKMTLPNLPRLSAWVREQRPGPGSRCTNVIAGDFIGADSFVGDVIALNQKLLWC
ncbi:PREDICTED: PI-PLC X domain-containing protein 1 [Colobus angolensis palliatus]|uniref:PI-PLC X domain-containing protein 1 n=1 Tax=Colobus angolensis palliatus TaxID=336983 RepID=UPI0005F42FFD|nr:PREDICTED: PI-PLC X domain-containing protein 1 [Colobus angolensis palliatus]